MSPDEIWIPDKSLHVLSHVKFDGEGDTSIVEHASIFLKFSEYYEIDYEDVACIIFFLTLEGQISWWCHTRPPTSIHSLEQIIKELHFKFDKYD